MTNSTSAPDRAACGPLMEKLPAPSTDPQCEGWPCFMTHVPSKQHGVGQMGGPQSLRPQAPLRDHRGTRGVPWPEVTRAATEELAGRDDGDVARGELTTLKDTVVKAKIMEAQMPSYLARYPVPLIEEDDGARQGRDPHPSEKDGSDITAVELHGTGLNDDSRDYGDPAQQRWHHSVIAPTAKISDVTINSMWHRSRRGCAGPGGCKGSTQQHPPASEGHASQTPQ